MGTAVLALRMVLAAVFALAGIAKLRDLEGSRKAMREFGLPERAAHAAGLLLPLAELAAAVALVFVPTARWGAVAALVLLVAFIAGIGNALRKGQAPDCHCFGQIHSSPAGPSTLVRNVVLAAMAIFVIAEGPGPALNSWVADRSPAELVAIGAGVAAAVFAALWFGLWRQRSKLLVDLNRAQRQAMSAAPGVPIGSVAPKFSAKTLSDETVSLDSLLARGRPILLVFMSTTCGSCIELLPTIARWQATLSERLSIAIVSTGSVKENRPMFGEYELTDVVLQEPFKISDAYRVRGTPSAVIVTTAGQIGSNPAETAFEIEPLLRLALSHGADAQLSSAV